MKRAVTQMKQWKKIKQIQKGLKKKIREAWLVRKQEKNSIETKNE